MNVLNSLNKSGFSLLESLIVLALFSLVMAGGMGMMNFISKERARVNLLSTLQSSRDKIYGLIEDGTAWKETINANTGLSCLQAGSVTPCNNGATVSPILHNQVGTSIFDPATQGFDNYGNICALSAGETNCPLKYNIQTKLSCGTEATCLKPAVVTTANLEILSNPNGFPINLNRFSMEIFHGGRGPSSTYFAPSYSKDCTDWESAGWDSKETCLKDGRWHLIYKNNPSGTPTFGSVNAMEQHIKNGAEFKIIHGSVTEICQQTYRSAQGIKPIYCLTGLRFAGEAPPFVKHSSARFGSDGSIWCLAEGTQNANACSGLSMEYEWLIKY